MSPGLPVAVAVLVAACHHTECRDTHPQQRLDVEWGMLQLCYAFKMQILCPCLLFCKSCGYRKPSRCYGIQQTPSHDPPTMQQLALRSLLSFQALGACYLEQVLPWLTAALRQRHCQALAVCLRVVEVLVTCERKRVGSGSMMALAC